MKKFVICIVSALICCAVIGFIACHIRATQSAAIMEVVVQRNRAHDAFQTANCFYVVQLGETLPRIANSMGISLRALESANKSVKIVVGQKLVNPQAVLKAISDYKNALDKIDPSKCPKTFQDAWMNYVKTWDLKNDPFIQQENELDKTPTKQSFHLGASEGLTTSLQIGSDIERPNLQDAADRLEKLDNNEAWVNCKHVALHYGVFSP